MIEGKTKRARAERMALRQAEKHGPAVDEPSALAKAVGDVLGICMSDTVLMGVCEYAVEMEDLKATQERNEQLRAEHYSRETSLVARLRSERDAALALAEDARAEARAAKRGEVLALARAGRAEREGTR